MSSLVFRAGRRKSDQVIEHDNRKPKGGRGKEACMAGHDARGGVGKEGIVKPESSMPSLVVFLLGVEEPDWREGHHQRSSDSGGFVQLGVKIPAAMLFISTMSGYAKEIRVAGENANPASRTAMTSEIRRPNIVC